MSLLEKAWGSKKAHRRRRRRDNGQIYFIQQGISGPIKVGWSTNPQKRFKTLQTANPLPLYILGVVRGSQQQEKALHRFLAGDHVQLEWFKPSDFVNEVIDLVIKSGNPDIPNIKTLTIEDKSGKE